MQYRKLSMTDDPVSILGYGCMRFPRKGGRFDEDRTEKQVVSAIEKGVNYFDTAYMYPGSEALLGKILSKGYRSKAKIATKIPPYIVYSRKDMENVLKTQLERLQTDYIDYYLVHAVQDFGMWGKAKQQGMIEFLEAAKKSGIIKNIGFSFHGEIIDFKKIIDDYTWDFCQIQYNYIDENYQAGREGLLYAHAKGIGVAAMEPLRGGKLVGRMPDEIRNIWDRSETKRSYAEWALRWLWNQPEVATVLSGLNEESHIEENIRVARETLPNSITSEEEALYIEVKEVYLRLMKIGCTGCGYCLPCPTGVNIPFCFSYYNSKHLFKDNHARYQYLVFNSGIGGGVKSFASQCIKCGKCEKVCPQHLPIRQHLSDVAYDMEPGWMRPLLWIIDGYGKIRRKLGKKRNS